MSSFALPAGFRAIPLDDAPGHFVWRLAAIVQVPESGPVELVLLTSLPDTRVFLGAVMDDRGAVREWVELWVQNLIGFSAAGGEAEATNALLDDRWLRHWRWVEETMPEAVIVGPEKLPAEPVFIGPEAGRAFRPRLAGGGAWELCRDDEQLEAAGLSGYVRSTTRYLRAVPENGGAACYVATDPAAPVEAVAQAPGPNTGFDPDWLPLNPQGGFLAIRSHPLLTFEDYVDLLNGATIDEIKGRRTACEGAALASVLAPQGAGGWRLPILAPRAVALERFYLKVRLLRQAVSGVESWLRRCRSPLLNLDPTALHVDVLGGDGFPWPWTTRCFLARPGRALAFAIPGSAATEFIAFGQPGLADFCPEGLGEEVDEEAIVRLLGMTTDAQDRIGLEGQIATRRLVRGSDHLRFRLRVSRLDELTFFGQVTSATGGGGTISFATWPRSYTAEQANRLRQEVGRRIVRCWCAFRPVISSPYDLYSLSVLGLRALLAHEKNPLTPAVAELEDFGRTVGQKLEKGASITQTGVAIEALLAGGKEWTRLQPVHVMGGLDPGALPDPPFPLRLWAEALAVLLRLTPGLGPVSQCADYGAAPPDALHAPLAEPLAALDLLTAKARSLLFDDWSANREARAILARLRSGG